MFSKIIVFLFNRFTLTFLAIGFLLSMALPNQTQAQCTPSSATICASGDDSTTIYVGGVLVGNFPYAGAPGTGNAGTPVCMSVPIGNLTGACGVNIAVATQNTAPQDTFSSWDLDITCTNGQHSEITSSSGGIQVAYVPTGNPSTPPANDSGGNQWFNPNYNNSPGAFGSGYCSGGVTASVWANPLYNPTTGLIIPFVANNWSGNYGTSVGALFWRQCVPIPPPTVLIGPPAFTITKAQASAVTNLGANTVIINDTIVVCNTGGPVTTGPTAITDNFVTNLSTCSAFSFVAWGYGDANCAYVIPYYNSCAIGNAPTVNSNIITFPNFGHGCVDRKSVV